MVIVNECPLTMLSDGDLQRLHLAGWCCS